MAFAIRAEIDGLPKLIRQLEGLRKGVRNKILRPAMRKSVSIVNKAAKGLVQTNGTGQLKRSLGVKVFIGRGGAMIGIVGPRPGYRTTTKTSDRRALRDFAGFKVRGGYKGPTWHDPRFVAHFVERGTRPRFNKRGAFRGVVTAKPFLGVSLVANETRIEGIFAEEIDKALAEAAQ